MSPLFPAPIILVFFAYGLAFFTIGLVVAYEAVAHIADPHMSRAMYRLAFFGLVHGMHEWLEMFQIIASLESAVHVSVPLEIVRIGVLAMSFFALCSFGLEMLHRSVSRRGVFCGGALILAIYVGGAGLLAHRFGPDLFDVLPTIDAWTRYSLGVGGGVLAMWGMVNGAQEYRRKGMVAVARGWFVTGIALGLYGLIGQTATSPSLFGLSQIYNSVVFARIFGFPVQGVRAGLAIVAAIGLLAALRALEFERQHELSDMRIQARTELERRETLQKELMRHIMVAQEEERSRIARELHDQTGQTLTALNLRVAALHSGQAVDQATLDDLRGLARDSLADLHQLVTDLRPAQLDDLGLVAALHWLSDQMSKRFGLSVLVDIEGKRRRLSGEVETALFRITQEALTNVARHAGASAACVNLCFLPDAVRIEVRDEGLGFDVKQKLDSTLDGLGAWGVIGMQERALSVGGRVQVISEPGRGTLILAIIPLMEGDEHG